MGKKDITAGDKIGKAKAARFINSKSGTPGIEVVFEFEEPTTGTTERLERQFWLSEKARETSMDTLVNTLGFNGSETIDAAGVFTDPNLFDWRREVSLVIEREEYQTELGETRDYPKIKWVNSIGGSGYASLTPDVVKNQLSNIGFRGLFLAAKQATVAKTGMTTATNQTKPSEEKLPF